MGAAISGVPLYLFNYNEVRTKNYELTNKPLMAVRRFLQIRTTLELKRMPLHPGPQLHNQNNFLIQNKIRILYS